MDYVHLRWLIGSVTDWTALMRQAYRVLKPGGWVEWFEMDGVLLSDDGTVGPKSAMGQWHHIFSNGARKLGSDASFRVVMDGDQRRSMEEAGFCNIQERCVKVRFGPIVVLFVVLLAHRCCALHPCEAASHTSLV
jgi:ubiquinone/menaquinone biosynthesis C-methylase UbiE